jgi:hypothetical protein
VQSKKKSNLKWVSRFELVFEIQGRHEHSFHSGREDFLIRTVRFDGGFIHLYGAEGTGSFLIWRPRQFDESLVCVNAAGLQCRDDVMCAEMVDHVDPIVLKPTDGFFGLRTAKGRSTGARFRCHWLPVFHEESVQLFKSNYQQSQRERIDQVI